MRYALLTIAGSFAAFATALILEGEMTYGGLSLYCAGTSAVAAFLWNRGARGAFYGWVLWACAIGGVWLGNAAHQAIFELRTTGDFAHHETHLEWLIPMIVVPLGWAAGLIPAAVGAGIARWSTAANLERVYPLLTTGVATVLLIAILFGAGSWTPWISWDSLCSPCP